MRDFNPFYQKTSDKRPDHWKQLFADLESRAKQGTSSAGAAKKAKSAK